jgi:1,4-dihydroxy-2-naphthoate octaprenyltransferase
MPSTQNEGHKVPVKGFLILSRLPFLSPGIASFTTGVAVAIADGHDPVIGLLGISAAGLALIMLVTYYFNEYFDYEGDVINKSFIKFSGGSRALPDKMISRNAARVAGYAGIAALAVIAVTYLVVYFQDYSCLLPMALYGAFCGVFYSHPPFQWSYQGIGEIMIGGCYGVLALVSGYYVVSGVLKPEMILVALPASLTIFAVIVANEFPDIEADRAVNKKNMVVRFGLRGASRMYIVAMVLAYPLMLSTVAVGVHWSIAITGLPVLAFSALAVRETLRGGYTEPSSQMKISAFTLLANLLSSLMFIPAVLIG